MIATMRELNDDYAPAAVCRRGHVQSMNIQSTRPTPKCPTCGATVIVQCENCGYGIRGYLFGGVGVDWSAPDFCDSCGAAHPWVSRQGRIYELQSRLEGTGLDPADELAAREQLEALMNPDISEDEERKRWQRVKSLAPQVWSPRSP